jgi:hypothetical protein
LVVIDLQKSSSVFDGFWSPLVTGKNDAGDRGEKNEKWPIWKKGSLAKKQKRTQFAGLLSVSPRFWVIASLRLRDGTIFFNHGEKFLKSQCAKPGVLR